MLWFVCACWLPAFVVSCLFTKGMRSWAPRMGLIDQPAARKVHTTPTPLGGGLGIFFGFIIPIAAAEVVAWWMVKQSTIPAWLPKDMAENLGGVLLKSRQLWGIIAAGALLAAMGVLDDLKGLSWRFRLSVHFSLAIALVMGGVRATVFVAVPWVGAGLTVLWIVVLINSFNFLDNMDALSGGIACIAAMMFAAVLLTMPGTPRWLVGGSLLVLSGSIAGFLVHNWPPAKIFMGDAGSTFIGLMLASLTILGTFYERSQSSRHVILAPLCVLAVPLYDFCSVLVIRLLEGRSPFKADKSHFSHRLVELGLSKRDAVLTVHLATLTTGLGALLLYQVPNWTGAVMVIALICCVLAIVAILETVGRKPNLKSEISSSSASPSLTSELPPGAGPEA